MYAGPILEENIVDPAIMNEYKNGDFHKMYVVSIDRILVKN